MYARSTSDRAPASVADRRGSSRLHDFDDRCLLPRGGLLGDSANLLGGSTIALVTSPVRSPRLQPAEGLIQRLWKILRTYAPARLFINPARDTTVR